MRSRAFFSAPTMPFAPFAAPAAAADRRPSDWATASLEHVLHSPEYVRVPDVPIFDEHDELDAKGNVVRRFGAAELQTIADRCNARARDTGDLSPFGPGHTFDDVYDKNGRLVYKAREEDQPPPWGFLHDYRLARYGPEQKLAIVADFYVRKRLTDAKGQAVDGLQYLKTFPRRSVELWPEDGIIDWVAVLRRTPQRDLGLLTYARAVHYVRQPASGAGNDGAALVPAAAVFGRHGKTKLRYAMGEHPAAPLEPGKSRQVISTNLNNARKYAMPDPTQTPSATAATPTAQPPDGAGAELSPEEAATAERYVKHCFMKHPVLKRMYEKAYAEMQQEGPPTAAPAPERNSAAAGPGGSDTFVPAGPERNSGSDELRGSNQAGQIRAIWHKDPHGDYHPDAHARGATGMAPDRFARDLAARDQRIAALERDNRLERYHRTLLDLQRGTTEEPGIELDLATELEIVQDFAPERFAKHCEHIAKHYRRVERDPSQPPGPMHLEPLPTAGPARGKPGKPQRMSKEQVDRAVELCQEDPNLSYPEALKRVAEGK